MEPPILLNIIYHKQKFYNFWRSDTTTTLKMIYLVASHLRRFHDCHDGISNGMKLVQMLLNRQKHRHKKYKPVSPYKIRKVTRHTVCEYIHNNRHCPASAIHGLCKGAHKIYFCTAPDLKACS